MVDAVGPLRIWSNYFTIAANTNLQMFEFDTEDDYRVRHIRSIFVGLTTSGISIALFSTNQEYSVIDLSRFAPGNPVLYVEFDVQAKISMKVGFQDRSGAGAAAVPVVIGYKVDPGSGP